MTIYLPAAILCMRSNVHTLNYSIILDEKIFIEHTKNPNTNVQARGDLHVTFSAVEYHSPIP